MGKPFNKAVMGLSFHVHGIYNMVFEWFLIMMLKKWFYMFYDGPIMGFFMRFSWDFFMGAHGIS